MRKRQVRRLRLLVRRLRARQIRLRSQQLRVRARSSARHVFRRPRNIHARRPRFAFRQLQRRLGLIHGRLIIARIDLHQLLPRFHHLVVLHQNFRNPPVNLRRDRRDVPVDLRVVRALAVVVVEEQSRQRCDQHHAAKNRQPLHLRIRQPCWLFFLERHFLQSGRTFAAFSNPTSISMLIVPSLRVNFFHLPGRTRKVRARLVKSVQRRNLVVVRSRQRILRLNHFNVVRHTRLEAVPRLIHFLLRKLHSQIRHLHLVARRIQIDQRRLHVQRDLISQIIFLLFQFLDFQIRLDHLRVDPAAREQRQIHARFVVVGG